MELSPLLQKDLSLWTDTELAIWLQKFNNGHFRNLVPIFRYVTGFDIATITDDDFRLHINHRFKDEPSGVLLALSCWRQLRSYAKAPAMVTPPPAAPPPKLTRRRKRSPMSFGSMLHVLAEWQALIDQGVSESSAARMLQDERVCRTTLRSWRHILQLAQEHKIDLASEKHVGHTISLSYVHKLILPKKTDNTTAIVAPPTPPVATAVLRQVVAAVAPSGAAVLSSGIPVVSSGVTKVENSISIERSTLKPVVDAAFASPEFSTSLNDG